VNVSNVDKAFGATFIDLEGLRFVASLAFRKGGYLFVYVKEGQFDEKDVQKEINEVFKELLKLGSNDAEFKGPRHREYRYTVLNEKNVNKAFSKVYTNFKRKRGEEEEQSPNKG
jgi:hypothetical protein